jgi:hypothetical protein
LKQVAVRGDHFRERGLPELSRDGRILATSAPRRIELRAMDGTTSIFLPLKSGFAEFPILSPDPKAVAVGWASPEHYFEYDLLGVYLAVVLNAFSRKWSGGRWRRHWSPDWSSPRWTELWRIG